MGTITFDPDQISNNASDIVDNDTDITSNASDASNAASDASNAASDASDAAIDASNAQSDLAVVEADDRYANSIFSKPAIDSFAITQIDVSSDSEVYISHSDVAAE